MLNFASLDAVIPNKLSILSDIGGLLTAESVAAQMAVMDRKQPILVEINSEGGSVADAVAIYNALRTWPAGVEVTVIGWALSAATVVAMAGRVIRMHETSLLMVHAPWMSTSGNATAMRERADLLDQVAATMRVAYGRTKQTAKVLDSWLAGDDHWFTAEQALAAGLVDEVISSTALAAAPANVFACRHTVPSSIREKVLSMNTPVIVPVTTTAAQTPDEIRAAAVRADGERRTAIRASFAKFVSHPGAADLQRTCEDDPTITAEAAGLKLLAHVAKDASPIAGHYVNRMDVQPGADSRLSEFSVAATHALMIRAGVRVDKPHPHAADLRRLSIVGMAERVLSMHGKGNASMSKGQIIQAALTTTDFPALLTGVTSTSMRTGYQNAPATHAGWTGEREVPDFRPHTLAMLSEGPSLLLKPEAAEYKYGAFSESTDTFSVKTYGRLVKVTREMLINDQLDALASIPNTMGAAARRLEADMVYAKLLDNPLVKDGKALFHADHGNLMTAAPLTVDSLGAARAAMRMQKGFDGVEFIDPQPRFLIVPVAMETRAEQLIASTVDAAKANNVENPAWIRQLTLVADPRLDAKSQVSWYLASGPQQMEGIVRAYLEGEARPFLEQKEGWTTDTMEYKVRLDIGVGLIDWRGLVKNPGQ